MQDLILTLVTKLGALKDDSGQDIVEYALVLGLIALGATASMQGLAATIAATFAGVNTKLSSYTT